MLKVYICEDNKLYREEIDKIINNIILIENYDMKIIRSTSDPYKILEDIKKQSSSSIYFLDIHLNNDINGIELASKIREIDPKGFIVFITTDEEMSFLTFKYKVEALDYIVKEEYIKLANRIYECIEEALKRYRANTDDKAIFVTKSKDKIINIEYSEILFFETSEAIHKIRVHSINRQSEFYAKMKELECQLGKEFIRCHNSYIVNRNNIKEIDIKNRVAIMKNGEQCLISDKGMRLLKNK